MSTKYVAYYRVSTAKQGHSGLGLESQRQLVSSYEADIIGEFTEIESGKIDNRPQLELALDLCRRKGAAILIAKIDRLSRDAAFLLTLRKAGVDIIAADMPNAGTLEFGVRAVVAQHEREEISKRTKQALQAAKARGVVLGCPTPEIGSVAGNAAIQARANSYADRIAPIVRDVIAISGASTLRNLATELSARGIQTPRGNTEWAASQVNALIKRLNINLKETSNA
jgi:DNA invertase Pin-like site-specific DNA recombinase